MTLSSIGFYPSLSEKPCTVCHKTCERGSALEHFVGSGAVLSSDKELKYNPVHVICKPCLTGRISDTPSCPECSHPIHHFILGTKKVTLKAPELPPLPGDKKAELTVALHLGNAVAVSILLNTFSLSDEDLLFFVPISFNSKNKEIVQLLLSSRELTQEAREAAIIKCAGENYLDILGDLLTHPEPISNRSLEAAFMLAAEKGSLESLQALCLVKPIPSYLLPMIVSKAALSGHESVVEFLLKKSEKPSYLSGSALLLAIGNRENEAFACSAAALLIKTVRPLFSQMEEARAFALKNERADLVELLK
jgi:hypothetical protein